jgi:hypothetical protein
MIAAEWGAWTGYVVVVALAALAKTAYWFRHGSQVMPARLESWVGLLLLALFVALGLGQWLGANFLAALIAFGFASALITGAAVNAAFQVGLKGGQRVRDNQAQR